MSYCIAWKKDNSVYMISESAISTTIDKSMSDKSTFGEIQGLYGKYFVQEGLLKIYKINQELILGFAGDVKLIEDLLTQAHTIFESSGISGLETTIENTYQGLDVQLIIVVAGKNPTIHYFDGIKFSLVDKCEIGCGKDINTFSKDVKYIIDDLYKCNVDKNDYLAMVLGSIQCYAVKKNYIQQGFGGTFYGAVIGLKINWFRDLEYYYFAEDITCGKTISVIARKSSIFSASDINKGTTFFLNKISDTSFWENLYFRRGIQKSLNTKNAYYYFLYSANMNVVAFLKVNGQTQNLYFRRWIRRGVDDVFYAYIFNPILERMFESYKNSLNIPLLLELHLDESDYMPHEDVYKICDINEIEKFNKNPKMDFDFNEFIFDDYDTTVITSVKKHISDYYNLVLIDFTYFCNVIQEKITMYSKYKKLDIRQLDLSAIVTAFLKQIAHTEFGKYYIVIMKDQKDNRIISDLVMAEYFGEYENCIVIESNNTAHDFEGTLFQLMKNYYLNDSFFHIDKFIICSDDFEVNRILTKVAPEFNYENDNPDIILVRNLNGLTSMDGRFRYIVIDYLVVIMLGISIEELGQLDALIEHDNYED